MPMPSREEYSAQRSKSSCDLNPGVLQSPRVACSEKKPSVPESLGSLRIAPTAAPTPSDRCPLNSLASRENIPPAHHPSPGDGLQPSSPPFSNRHLQKPVTELPFPLSVRRCPFGPAR